MSKTKKFLSIALNMLEEMPEIQEKYNCAKVLKNINGDKMEAALKEIQGYLEAQGMSFVAHSQPEWNRCSMGSCHIQVTQKQVLSEETAPSCAQIKLFPLNQNETPQNFSRVNGRIDMIREMTDASGKFKIDLPQGTYALEISKGSEYEVIEDFITVHQGQEVKKNYLLTQYVDLKKMGWYAGDLHHHSIFSSPVYEGTDDVKESPQEVCRSMRAMGASYGALSDHHNILNHEIWSNQKEEGFVPICSKEISTSNGHVLALGVKHDVIYNIPEDSHRTDSYLREEFLRITDEIKKAGGLAQLNHPKDESVSISWNPEFNDMLPIFETIEIWNGSHPMCKGTINAKAGELWRNLLEQGNFIPATTGSDTHNIKANDYHTLMDEILWIDKEISAREDCEELKSYQQEIMIFSIICKELLPFLEEWAETNLTSAAVRTYVNLSGEPDPHQIMDALRNGKTFLTNGPIILPSIQGKTIGDTVQLKEDCADITVRIMSNHPLSKLYLYTGANQETLIELEPKRNSPYYDYSIYLENVYLRDTSYIFFAVANSPIHLAITNPMFIAH